MYPKGIFRPCREATEAILSEQLPRLGFAGEPKHFTDGAFRRWWLRDHHWRIDVVELVFRRGGELRMLINFFVLFPLVQPTEPGPRFDGCGVLTPSLPYWFPHLRVRSYALRVWRAVEAELPWFEGRSTPARCFDLLQGHHNSGPQGGAFWQVVHDHLSTLVNESPNPSLQRTPPG
jgi:hypothetical protein